MSALVVLFAVVVAAFVAITVVFAFIGAIMEFVFVESLREREVHVHEYANAYWRRGLRLFGFRLVFGLLALAETQRSSVVEYGRSGPARIRIARDGRAHFGRTLRLAGSRSLRSRE
ncbi:hypothetical protein BRD06_01625, partial [Halobacteriales archaeon QS_9_67_15]